MFKNETNINLGEKGLFMNMFGFFKILILFLYLK